MKRLLIISPQFPPKNTPDHHRVRTSLPYYRKFGWEPTVLAITPESADNINDPALLESVDPQTRVVRVAAWRESITREVGFGQLSLRALWPVFIAGYRLLARERFDVVFFSSTAFMLFVLARPWKHEFGCKIVFDFQDPWYDTSTSHRYTAANAPGGLLKYRANQALARQAERFALRAADHIISVSQGYVDDLSSRYPWLRPDQFSVIPFGAAPDDYSFQRRVGIRHRIFEKKEGTVHWVFVGRGGPDLHPVLTIFFQQLARLRQSQSDLAKRLHIHFVGTNYAADGRGANVIEPLAVQQGVGEMVSEHRGRIPYFEALSLMSESDAVFLAGTVSADYTASKLFNCVLSGKPVLALFNAQSLVSKVAPEFTNVFLASFQASPEEPAFAQKIVEGLDWLLKPHTPFNTESALRPYTAESLTARQCEIFDRITAKPTA